MQDVWESIPFLAGGSRRHSTAGHSAANDGANAGWAARSESITK